MHHQAVARVRRDGAERRRQRAVLERRAARRAAVGPDGAEQRQQGLRHVGLAVRTRALAGNRFFLVVVVALPTGRVRQLRQLRVALAARMAKCRHGVSRARPALELQFGRPRWNT